jgi:cell division septum initiation protein DivIVA
MNNDKNIFVGDDDHAKQQEPLDYRLRAATKRTDLPDDVIRLLADAYYEVYLGRERVQVLRDKYDSLLDTNVELEARNKNLKEGFEGGCHLCEVIGERNQLLRESNKAAWAANEEMEKKNAELLGNTEELRQQRDEARRDVCDMMHITGFLAGDYAASRGWDCFPDRKRNVSDEVKNFRTIIERDYNAVVAQRDEARRDACNNHAMVMDESDFEKTALRYAEENGWDCFQNGWSCKENKND